ncbi:MAG: response regulator [Pseudomonadales bacterium]
MTSKRALVVDDSRTARQSLATLLQQYDLSVDFAVSGEAALEFLEHELVDVIFMDHSMPGMDGLEAVAAIKRNPRTATIPVMMYTAREGEVYVSQARALGALGVLPKEVQPGVLYDMLNQLGLVNDRRDADAAPPPDAPRRRFADLLDEVDREYDNRALGASVQALITRLLEEQHQKLRAHIAAGQRRFARDVARELAAEQRAQAQPAEPDHAGLPADAGTGAQPRWLRGAAVALTVAVLVLGMLTWQLLQQRNAALLEIARMTTASRNELAVLLEQQSGLSSAVRSGETQARAQRAAALEALTWALNQGGRFEFGELPFADAQAARAVALVDRLAAMGFQGNVVLTAHLGSFCLSRDDFGELALAADDVPVEACDQIGHPLAGASLATLQSVAFADIVDAALAQHQDITLELAAADASDGAGAGGSGDLAGDWNRAAARDNRVTVTLQASGA